MSTADLFQHRSIDLTLGGRYSLASRYDIRGSRREFACRTSRVSPYQMHVSVPVLGPVGERVVTYFGDFGSLDGWITDIAEGGFLLNIELPRQRREKFVAQLAWLKKRQDDVVADARAQRRIVPKTAFNLDLWGRDDAQLPGDRHLSVPRRGLRGRRPRDRDASRGRTICRVRRAAVCRRICGSVRPSAAFRKPGTHHLPAEGSFELRRPSCQVRGQRRAGSARRARKNGLSIDRRCRLTCALLTERISPHEYQPCRVPPQPRKKGQR